MMVISGQNTSGFAGNTQLQKSAHFIEMINLAEYQFKLDNNKTEAILVFSSSFSLLFLLLEGLRSNGRSF